MTWGKEYWPIFLIVVSVLFAVPELYALFTNVLNTLSDYSWFELHVRPGINRHTIAWWISLSAWAVFAVVITGHIWFRNPS